MTLDYISKRFLTKGGGRLLGKHSRGAILIEFAFAVPIMIMLLYYIHDLVRLKRFRSQMQFVAHQMASMLQNVSQNRTDKEITKNDIRYVASASYLTIFPGTSQFTVADWTSKYGYNPMLFIFYVKGNSDSTASVVWAQRYHSCDFARDPSTFEQNGDIRRNTVNNLQNVAPSRIYPSLKIEPNEVKIIVECAIHYSTWSAYTLSDGRKNSDRTAKEAFGLYVHPLKAVNEVTYFNSVVIFSPRPGLFSETAPK